MAPRPFAAPPPAFAKVANLVAKARQPAKAARTTVPVFTFAIARQNSNSRLIGTSRIDRTIGGAICKGQSGEMALEWESVCSLGLENLLSLSLKDKTVDKKKEKKCV